MKIAVILENSGGVLDRRELDVPNDDDAIDDAISATIEIWTLAVGDTIRIVEA